MTTPLKYVFKKVLIVTFKVKDYSETFNSRF